MDNQTKSMDIDARHRVFKRLPNSLKSSAKLVYSVLAAPFGGQKSRNRMKYQLSAGKTQRINYVPPVFSITISSSCNLRCPNCYYVLLGGEKAFAGGAMIKVEDFRSIIEKYGDKLELVSLTGGEALAHPQLDQLVDILNAKGVKANTSTNGIFIDRKLEVLKKLDYVNVSLDGYDYPSFQKYRGGTPDEFDKILNGLKLLKENNIPFGNSFVLSEENLDEVGSMLELARETKPFLVTFHNINPHGCEDFTPLTAGSEKVQQALKEVTGRSDYPFDIELPVIFDTESPSFPLGKCPQLWSMACFNDKGHLSYCCYIDHDPTIGNMFEGYDFNSKSMLDFRRRMIDHEFPEDSCRFCHKRFMGQEYGYFNAAGGSWILQGFTGGRENVIPMVPTNIL